VEEPADIFEIFEKDRLDNGGVKSDKLDDCVVAAGRGGTGGASSSGVKDDMDFLLPNNRLNPFFPTDPVFCWITDSSRSATTVRADEVESSDLLRFLWSCPSGTANAAGGGTEGV
jgi:hypothetical protein